MAIRLSPAMKLMVLEGGVQSLAGGTFAIPHDPNVGHVADAQYVNAEPVTLLVADVDMDGMTVRLDEPMRVVMAAPDQDVRCPDCGKKLAERLTGTIEVTCPRCKRRVTIAR